MRLRSVFALGTTVAGFVGCGTAYSAATDDAGALVDEGGTDGTAMVDASGVLDAPATDGAAADGGDGGHDADSGPRCDPTADFGAATALTELRAPDGLAASDYPRLSSDERTIVFSRRLAGPVGNMYTASRSSRGIPFGPVTLIPLAGPGTDAGQESPNLSPDALTLYFSSGNHDSSDDIYFSTRSSADAGFSAPAQLGFVSAPYPYYDYGPFLSADGSELFFTSNRPGVNPAYGIYRSVLSGGLFGSAVVALGDPTHDYRVPVLSNDGLALYVAVGGAPQIYVARRSSRATPFGAPAPVVFAAPHFSNAWPGWLSPDNCRLYFRALDAGYVSDIYVAERPLVP